MIWLVAQMADTVSSAVEAVARALFTATSGARMYYDPPSWDEIGPDYQDNWRRSAKVAIDVAAPLIASAALRGAADAAEKVSMVHDQDSDDGWRKWLRERAAALAEGQPCRECDKPAIWIECPTGSWWSHVDHPADEHDAEIEVGG